MRPFAASPARALATSRALVAAAGTPAAPPARRAALLHALALAALPLLAAAPAPVRAWGERIVGSGTPATEQRPVTGYSGVSVAGGIDLLVRQAAAEAVQVRADDNLLPYLETVVDDGVLQVRWRRGTSVGTRGKVLVTVDAVRLRQLSSSGAGDTVVERVRTPELKVALAGSGSLQLSALDADELGLRISGSGDVRGDGRAGKLEIAIAGSGDVALAGLRADDVAVRIAGSGDAAVSAARTLKVGIAGSGDVRYTGDPVVTTSIAGSGSVKKR